MKKLTGHLIFIFIFGLSLCSHAQLSLIITLNDGSQSGVLLTQLNKMTFLNGNLNIQKADATVAPFSTANIQKMTFGVWSGVESVNNLNNLQVFPNPTTGIFGIKTNFQYLKTAYLTTVDGRILRALSAQELLLPIDITEFPNGIYILKTNTEYFKIIKQ